MKGSGPINPMQKHLIKLSNSFIILQKERGIFEYNPKGEKIPGFEGYPTWEEGINSQSEVIYSEDKSKAYFSPIFCRHVYEFDTTTKTTQIVYTF